MKLQFRRRQVETLCTYVAYILLLLVLILWIFYRADSAFNWDILPPDIQRIIESFVIPSIGGIIFIAVVLSVVLNISLASINLEQIAQEKSNQPEKEKTDLTISRRTRKTLIISVVLITLILFGFKLWDKWESKSRINDFIEEYANAKNLKTIDSLLGKLNYQDTLQYKVQWNNNYRYIQTRNDSILGLSNISTFNKLKNEFEKINKLFTDNNKRSSLNSELLINFNKSWVGINNYNPYLAFDDNNEILHLNLNDFLKRIFKGMDKIVITDNDGYEIYYRINDSRSFEIAILSKSKPTALLNFEYNLWR